MSNKISLEQMVAIIKMRLVNRVVTQNPGKGEKYSWTDIAEAIGNIISLVLNFEDNEQMHDSLFGTIDNHTIKDNIDAHFYEILTQPYGLDGLDSNSAEFATLINGEDPTSNHVINKLETTKIKSTNIFENNDEVEINLYLFRDEACFMTSGNSFPYYVDGTSSIFMQSHQIDTTQRDERTGLYYEVSYPKTTIDICLNSEIMMDRHLIAFNITYVLLKLIDNIYCKNSLWDFGTPILFNNPDNYEPGDITRKSILSLIAIELVERFSTISIRELKDIIFDNLCHQLKGAISLCSSGACYKAGQILRGESSTSIDKGLALHRERLSSQEDCIAVFMAKYFEPYFNNNQ